jgi:putative SOS response-associated peptidase YedK
LPFAFAGLFEAWRPPGAADDADWLLTCCVITTAPNALMAPIHDRMPVILPPEQWARWLDRSLQDPAELAPLLGPADSAGMQAWPVSRAVNRGTAEGEELVDPLPTVG